MGKNLIQQRRGRGTFTYKSFRNRYKGKPGHSKSTDDVKGKIIDLIHCAGHTAPLALVKYENGEKGLMIACEGLKIGDEISSGKDVLFSKGNSTRLGDLPEGSLIYNIEINPGDGGKIVRAGGSVARIVAKLKNKVIVQLPSKKQKTFLPECRASLGIVAGGGRKEKPFVKAGTKYHSMKAKNKLYPHVSGVSMNAVDHPFGGGSSSHKGIPTQCSRNAPPGRKVGKIAPKRTGRKKGKA